jgi:hypothetical protein
VATLSTTTLGAAVGATALTVPLASVANVSVGQWLYVDSEALAVTAIAGLWVTARRGVGGTLAADHPSGATVTIGDPSQFYDTDPVGVPPSPVLVTPWINVLTGTQWVVSGSTWVPTTEGGITEGNVVGPASATSGTLASYSGTTGKLLADSGVAAASVVVGPSSAVSGTLASYSGTTGKLVADSGKVAANVVTGPASATDNAVARFDATTGKIVQDSAVTIADTTGDLVTAGDVRAATFHVGATAGADSGGALTSITSITVVKGIVTAITGT